MSRSTLIRRTDNQPTIREVISLEESHQLFLAALIDEVRQRTGRRLDRSQIVQALIDAVLAAELTPSDVLAAERRRLAQRSLDESRAEILDEIHRCEEGMRLALIESPTDSAVIREYRRNLRFQKERLKAVDELLDSRAAERAAQTLELVESHGTAPVNGASVARAGFTQHLDARAARAVRPADGGE